MPKLSKQFQLAGTEVTRIGYGAMQLAGPGFSVNIRLIRSLLAVAGIAGIATTSSVLGQVRRPD